jgi:arylsulfatase A-like enzyme
MGTLAAAMAVPGCRYSYTMQGPGRNVGPNIIYILADDLGYGDPVCYNEASRIPTPSMDRLAAEGMRFADAHSGSAVCTPTRYGLLTGRYAWRTPLKKGVLWGYSPPLVEQGRLTVASYLRRRGYHTACIGKWHMGLGMQTTDGLPADDQGSNVNFTKPIKHGPQDLGFDYFFGISASLDMPPYVYIENNRFVGTPTEMTREGGRLGLTEPGFKAVDVLPDLTRKAVEFVKGHVGETPTKPFFLYFPLTAPHTPVVPAEFIQGASQAGEYGDFCAQVDRTIGEVMKALDELSISDDTLLIVTSDNGSTMQPMKKFDHLPNAHLRGRKSDVWDGGHRIPFIARWPRVVAPGTVSNETLCLTDLLATCFGILGDTLPDDAGEDSYNMLPALQGRTAGKPIREATVHHSIDGMFAIRQGPWKLVLGQGSGGWSSQGMTFTPGDPPGQLYNMTEDPSETTNLYTERPELVEHLAGLLEKYKREGRSTPRRSDP